MTDEQAFLDLMQRFNITPQESHEDAKHSWCLNAHDGNVEGYMGFSCSWDFDKDGKFLTAGVWE